LRVGRQGRRTPGRLLWISTPLPWAEASRGGDRQIAAIRRLRPLPSSAQPHAHSDQHPRRPAGLEQ
jgi:hypothetical protein